MRKVLKQQWSYFSLDWEPKSGDMCFPTVHISPYFLQLESKNKKTQDLLDEIYYIIDDLWYDIDVVYNEAMFATQDELEKEVTRYSDEYWQKMQPYIRELEKAEKDGML